MTESRPPEPPSRPRVSVEPVPRTAPVVVTVVLVALLLAAFPLFWRGCGWLALRGTELRYDDGDGWHAVPLQAATRRLWGEADAFLVPAYAAMAPGLELGTVRLGRGADPRAVDVVVARIDPARWRFRVWGRNDWSPGSVDQLARQAGLALAVNAAYFSDEGPIGLVVSDGVFRNRAAKRRAAHFLVVGGRPEVVSRKRAPLDGVTQGFQGFPAVMAGGRTFSYMRDGGRGFDIRAVDRRTAGCVTRDARVLLLVTDTLTGGLSLAELATVLGGLGCVDAMAFDGGSSTGLSLRLPGHVRRVDNPVAVPVVLGVEAGG